MKHLNSLVLIVAMTGCISIPARQQRLRNNYLEALASEAARSSQTCNVVCGKIREIQRKYMQDLGDLQEESK